MLALSDLTDLQLLDVPPLTALLIQTLNSVYRVVVVRGCEVYVHGGGSFPDPTRAWLEGSSIGGVCIKAGWIGVGFALEIRSRDRRIITSPVRAIWTEEGAFAVVH